MRKDYHMHPAVLQTPERFELFVKKAREEGIDEICVTDHMPLLCSNAKDRIPRGRVRDYCKAVRALAEQYKSLISIKTGIEIDYHPSVTDEIERVLAEGDFDYVLGSSHLHVVKAHELFDGSVTHNEYARLMFENTVKAAKSGYFNAIAHIDMFKAVFQKADKYPLINDGYLPEKHAALIDEALDAVKENGLRLEINPHLAESTGNIEDVYPCRYIAERALNKGLLFSFGSDAHVPQSVGAYLKELESHPVYGEALKSL